MAHSFIRVGNAPRFVLQISNLKSQISNLKSQIEQSGPAGLAVKRATANRVQYTLFGTALAGFKSGVRFQRAVSDPSQAGI